jgi:energy-coupling factor transporter ATP-binding protein EcfA2
MSFKIIAIRPLENCADNIVKNLVRGEFYFFDNTYKPNIDLTGIEKKEEQSSLPSNFFSLQSKNSNTSLESINIHAVVGKNGSGKSSLMELMVRVLNNFFKKKTFITLTKRLRYSKGVAAELYFSIDDNIYKIEVDTSQVKVNGGEIIGDIATITPEPNNISNELFFTMYINYSHYGLDSYAFSIETLYEEMDDKEKPWLDKIFHKNDGYQTQLVIHPWRDNGQINVRNEKELIRQRLISQILLHKSYENFTDNLLLHSLSFRFKNEDHLEKSLKKMSNLVESATSDSTAFYTYEVMRQFFEKDFIRNAEFYVEIRDFVAAFAIIDKDGNKRQPRYSIDFSEEYEGYKYLFDSHLKYIADLSLCFHAIEEEVGSFLFYKESVFLKNLFLYAVTKLKKIFSYPRYEKFDFGYNEFNIGERSVADLIKDISSVIEHESHISIKLKQALELLKFANKNSNHPLIIFYEKQTVSEENSEIDLVQLRQILNSAIEETIIEAIFFVPPPIFEVNILLDQNERIKYSSDGTMGMSEKNLISWTEISSGELQKISVISSLVYHLSNLDTVVNEENFYNYENVNILLDEIELYFHPEYQRTFIYDLLSKLETIVFKQIKNINLTFITHSPFVLSDIPSQNILKLKDGKAETSNVLNSFAANIHDLLKDDFFLKGGSMGEFAKQYVNFMINELSSMLKGNNDNYRSTLDEAAYKSFKSRIKIIGEPLIRNSLLEMLDELKMDTPIDQEELSYERLLAFYKKFNN